MNGGEVLQWLMKTFKMNNVDLDPRSNTSCDSHTLEEWAVCYSHRRAGGSISCPHAKLLHMTDSYPNVRPKHLDTPWWWAAV